MPRNGSGTFSLVSNSWNPAVNGINATATDWQTLANDLAAGLTQSVSSDGQTPMTGNLPMGNNKITGLANGTNSTDAINLGQARSLGPTFPGPGIPLSVNTTLTASQAGNWFIVTSASVTATLPALAGMLTGQTFSFMAGTFGATLKGNASEALINGLSASANTLVLMPGETVMIAANGSAWYVVEAGLGSPTFAGVKTTPGYQKLPGGLILQWGTNATGASGITVTWPIPFPTSLFAVVIGPSATSGVVVTYQTPTTTSAYFQGWAAATGTQTNTGFSFFALGY